jgi:peptide/nickel transport system substrate-binding protein/oligopeptide transport system substrate-binding protein
MVVRNETYEWETAEGQAPPAWLDRRTFLTRAALMGTGGVALAACSSGTPKTGPSTQSLNKNATLNFQMSTTIPGLDPQKWWNGAAGCGQFALFETLLMIDPYTQRLVPQLATGMPAVSNNGHRLTFTLRKGVKFTNGQPLTSADVKYSFERLVIPSFGAQAGSLYIPLGISGMADVLNQKAKTLSGITTPDPQTIVFDFDYPDSAFIWLISFNSAGVVPKSLVESVGFNHFNWHPVGTGPFTANVTNQQSQIQLKRNAGYWKPGVPSYAGVNWQMGVADTLSMIRIEAGQTDMMFDPVPAGYVAGVLNNPTYVRNHQVVKTPQDNCYWMSLSLKNPLFKDVRVRQAIAMAIDKARILQVMNGLGHIANGGFFSPLSPYYQDGLAYPYNPAKAKSLIAAAGVPKGATVKMWSSNRFPYQTMGQVIQANLASIGIAIDYIPMEYDAFANFTATSPSGIMLWAWELYYPSGSYIVDSAFTTGAQKAGCCDYPWFSSHSFDQLTVDAHRSTNSAEVIALYKQMDKIVVTDEALWVPLIYPVRLDLVSSRVRNFQAAVGAGEDQSRFFYKYALT